MGLRVIENKKPKTLIAFWFGVVTIIVILYVLFFGKSEKVSCSVGQSFTLDRDNFPFELYNECSLDAPKLFIGKKCTKFPIVDQLEFDNLLWQKTKTTDGVEIYLLAAYYDNRSLGAVLKILATSEETVSSDVICQIWFKNHGAVVVSSSIENLSDENDRPKPLLISCDVPEIFDDTMPRAVSVTSYECSKSTNVLRVDTDRNNSTKTKFGVCAVNFFWEIAPRDFVEWIEFTKSLGASKVYLYSFIEINNRPIRKIIDYYQTQGFLEQIPFTLPGRFPNILALQKELLRNATDDLSLLSFHDCFYSHLQEYDRISFFKYATIKNLSINPYVVTKVHGNLISSYSTKEVTLLGNKYTSPKCLNGESCHTNDVTIEFSQLEREALSTLLNRREKVLSHFELI